jgi:hypothetical protein
MGCEFGDLHNSISILKPKRDRIDRIGVGECNPAPIPDFYQLDLTTPGSKPWCAHSRKTLRDKPKSR